MNESTDRLDDRIHALTRTATAHTGAPSLDEIRYSPPLVAHVHDPQRNGRWLAVAAVLVLAIVGATFMVRSRQSKTAAEQPVADLRPSLGAYVLPEQTPPGWQLIDVGETAGDATQTAAMFEVEQIASGKRAIVAVDPPHVSATDPSAAAGSVLPKAEGVDPQWTGPRFENYGTLSWNDHGQTMLIFVAGSDETLARDVQSHIGVLETALSPPTFDDPTTYRVVRTVADSAQFTGSANLLYTDGDSTITVSLGRAAIDIDVLLDPSVVNAPAAVYQEAGNTLVSAFVVRDAVTVRLLWPAPGPSAITPVAVGAFLDSFRTVSSTDFAQAAQTVSSLIESQPTVSAVETRTGTLTVHRGPSIDGICFATEAAHKCRFTMLHSPDDASTQMVSPSLIVDGAWIYVRQLTGDEMLRTITTNIPDLDAVRVESPPVHFAIVTPPAAINDFVLTIGDGDQAASEEITRPLR